MIYSKKFDACIVLDVEKPVIFIEGGIHAREWISPATVTFFIRELVTNADYRDMIGMINDGLVSITDNNDTLEMYDWIIVPVVNPDGYEFSHTDDRMWRKNRGKSKSLLNIISNCRGIDLNRNFGYNWGEVDVLR